jgi:hypothetical protein
MPYYYVFNQQLRRMGMKKSLTALVVLMGMAGLALAQPYGMGPGMGAGPGMGPCNPQVMPCGPGMGARGMRGGQQPGKQAWLDTDGDGRISLEEHNAFAEQRFARFDTDGDGTVTRDEFTQRSAERFKQMDVNGDGFITSDERRGMRQQFRQQRGYGRQQPGPAGAQPAAEPAIAPAAE